MFVVCILHGNYTVSNDNFTGYINEWSNIFCGFVLLYIIVYENDIKHCKYTVYDFKWRIVWRLSNVIKLLLYKKTKLEKG